VKEALGNIVGISDHCGHALTCITYDTQDIIYHSLVRPDSPDDAYLLASMFMGEEDDHSFSNIKPVIKSRHNLKYASKKDGEANNYVDGKMNPIPTPVFNPEDLIGKTFLIDKQEDGY
jgi:hypothetical protein